MAMDALNDAIVANILRREGGDSDHPSDHGGITKFGITIPFLTDRLGRQASPHDIKALTRESAAKHYADWMRSTQLDRLAVIDSIDMVIPDRFHVADCAVDWAVQTTAHRAVKTLQEAIGFSGVDVDGIVGPATLRALGQADTSLVLRRFAKMRVNHRVRRVRQDVSQVDFLAGWIARDLEFL